MRRPWIAYLVTALGACVIGVAIAGLPDSLPGGGDDPATAVVVAVSVVETTEPSSPTTVAPTTAPTTTLASPPTTAATTTAPPTTTTQTTIPTTTTTSATTTTTTATTTTATPTTTTAVAPEPTEAAVAVANGAGVPGVAGAAAELLVDAGFDDVSAVDSEPVDVTTVYFEDGFEQAADLVALTLFIDPEARAPMTELPDLDTDEEFDVVAVLGADIES